MYQTGVTLEWLDCMEVGEVGQVSKGFKVRAVPGGWIYQILEGNTEMYNPPTGPTEETRKYTWTWVHTFVPDPRITVKLDQEEVKPTPELEEDFDTYFKRHDPYR